MRRAFKVFMWLAVAIFATVLAIGLLVPVKEAGEQVGPTDREKKLLARLAYLEESGVGVRVDDNSVWLAFEKLTICRSVDCDPWADYKTLAQFAASHGHKAIGLHPVHVYVVKGKWADLTKAMNESLFVCSISARGGRVVRSDCR